MNKNESNNESNNESYTKSRELYQVIVVDTDYDNWEEVGWFGSTEDASRYLRGYILNLFEMSLEMNDFRLVDKDNNILHKEDLNRLINMPDSFIVEYASTFNSCIDRPCISWEELLDECFCDSEGNQLVFFDEDADGEPAADYGYGPDDCALTVRGFVHHWPEPIANMVIKFWDDIRAAEDEFRSGE